MTHINPIAAPAIVLVLIFALILSGCSSSQVVTDLEVAVDAVSVALPVLGGVAGLPPAVATAVEGYLSAVNNCLAQASTILAEPNLTDAQKAAQITAACTTAAVPNVPAQYQALANAIANVAGDLAKFLAGLPTGTVALTPGASHAGKTTKFSGRDLERISHAKVVAATNAQRLASMHGSGVQHRPSA